MKIKIIKKFCPTTTLVIEVADIIVHRRDNDS